MDGIALELNDGCITSELTANGTWAAYVDVAEPDYKVHKSEVVELRRELTDEMIKEAVASRLAAERAAAQGALVSLEESANSMTIC